MTSACTFSLLWGSEVLLVVGAGDQGSCGPPTRLYFAELIEEYRSQTSFPVGSTVEYKCRPGYYGQKTSLKCLESLEWSEAPNFCKGKSCGNPGEPANGRLIVPKDLNFGSTVNFICDEGHRLIGPSSIRCIIITGPKVGWSGRIPFCQRIPCYPPPDIPHGKQKDRYNEEYHYGDAVTYTCDKGYPHVGDSFIQCTTEDGENGVWSGHLSCGGTPCPAPHVENGNIVAGNSDTYTYKDKITLGCSAGHVLTGSREIYCQADGTWDPPIPFCERAVQCSTPQRIANGKYNSQTSEVFTKGAFVEYSCEPGYKLIGEARIYCTESGSWSSPAPHCEVKQCQRPPNIQHGNHSNQESAEFTNGMFVKYTCEPGYTLIGETTIYCTKSGTWSPPAPHCEALGSCGPPTRLKFAELIDEYKNKTSFPVGSTVKYMCRPGYSALRTTVKCLSNRKWSDIKESCRKKSCGNPGEPENGRLIVPEDLLFGSTVNFTCDDGYKLIGQSFIQCVLSGQKVIWSGEIPFCQPIQCYPPPDILHGKQKVRYNEKYYYGDAVTYTCDKGYSHVGDAYIHCTTKDGENGVWSGRLSCGVTPCPAPQAENGNIVAGNSDTYTYKDKVTLGCSAGHILTGSREIYCQADGTWDPPVPLCERVSHCPLPPDIANGNHNATAGKIFTTHMTVTYFCDPGYSLNGKASITCTSSGDWSLPWPHCEAVQCSTPQRITNGKYNSQESEVFTQGASVEYSCEPGYHLIGEATIYCSESGSWSSHPPYCKVVQCPSPPKVLHGKYSALELATFTNGKSIKYYCEPGYVLIGEATVYCTASGAWSLPVPRCEVKGCVGPEIQNGRKSSSKRFFKPTEKVTFECEFGYILKGNTTIQCQSDSMWDLPVPLCVRVIQCHRPPQVQNGFHSNQESAVFNDGMSVKYRCEHGYTLIGEATVYCTKSGTWHPPAPRCEALQCIPPPSISNSEHDGHGLANFPVGTCVNYTCNLGYVFVGDASSCCTTSGAWSRPIPQCEVMRCPLPPRIAHGSYFGANFTYQMSVIYVCDAGYFLVGNPMVTCTLQGSDSANWSQPPQCKVIQCHRPPQVQNGFHSNQESAVFNDGMSVKYRCEHGYTLIGETTIYCTESGTWHPPAPRCEALQCIPPPSISNGEHDGHGLANFPVGTCVNYTCNPGYMLVGDASSCCTTSGAWSRPIPQCEVMRCPLPPRIAHGSYFGANFTYQMSVIYVCDAGYFLVGNPMVTCTLQGSDSANWSQPPQCKGCLAPQQIANGKPDTEVLEDFAYGSSVTYHCDPGYFLTGAATIYCRSSGMWEPPVPQCIVKGCVFPEIQNGKQTTSTLLSQPRETISFECAPGYILKGNNTIECQSDGTWDLPVPLCVRATGCILPQIPGGKMAKAENMFQSGENVTVQCEDGYVLEGSPYIQCQHDFTWDPPVPVCKVGFYGLASISFGSLVGFLLFSAISVVIWMAVSKRNKARYTPANSKEISDNSNDRI